MFWTWYRQLAAPTARRSTRRPPGRRPARSPRLALERLEDRTLLSGTPWVELGPAPIRNDGTEGLTAQGNPGVGPVQAIAADPANADRVFVATLNGGVWGTTNATSLSPDWAPLTDDMPSLALGDIALSPTNANTIYAGTGAFTLGGLPPTANQFLTSGGGRAEGVLRSTDGGQTWQLLGQSTFAPTPATALNIRAILPTTLSGGLVVLAGTYDLFDPTSVTNGLYRSTDGGANWTRISGEVGTNLPDGSVTDIVSDPGDLSGNRIYCGVSGQGVYKSTDGGLTWAPVYDSSNPSAADSGNIRLSIHNSVGNNVIYAGFVNRTTGILSEVICSTNQGGSWTSLGVPADADGGITVSQMGGINFSLLADKTDPAVVFAGGDTQPLPVERPDGTPNTAGARDYSGRHARYNGTSWQIIDAALSNNTSAHAGSRDMEFDANGNILEADDGGIYRLLTPNTPATRTWQAAVGDLRITEIASVAYDSVGNIVFAGADDGNGTPVQLAPDSLVYQDSGTGGYGRVTAVDNTSTPGFSIHYTTGQLLGGFQRATYNSAGQLVGSPTQIALNGFDPADELQVNPYVLNAIDPTRMLIGGAVNVYESLDRGDNVTVVDSPGVARPGESVTALAYGGMLGGVANLDVAWVGTEDVTGGGHLRLRTTSGGAFTELAAYTGGQVVKIVLDPDNWQRAYVIGSDSRIFLTTNAGTSFTDVTGDLDTLTRDVFALTLLNPTTTPGDEVLYAGGFGGVFVATGASISTDWSPFGVGLPQVNVADLQYNAQDHVLIAGTYGRGIWKAVAFPPLNFVLGTDNQVYAVKLGPLGTAVGDYFVALSGQVKEFTTGHDAFGNPMLFVLGLDNRVYAATFDSAGDLLHNYELTTPTRVQSFNVGQNADNNPVIFALGTDGRVSYATFDPDAGEFNTFQTITGRVKAFSVGTDARGNAELFVIGTNDVVFTSKYNPTTGQFGAYTTVTAGAVRSLEVGTDAAGNPEVFVVSTDSQAYTSKYNPGTGLFGTYTLVTAGTVRDLAAGSTAGGDPALFAVRTDGQLYVSTASGGVFGGYALVAAGVVNAVTVSQNATNNPVVFVRGTDNRVYSSHFSGGSYTAYAPTPATGGAVKGLAVTYNVSYIPKQFVIDSVDNKVYFSTFTGTQFGPYALAANGAVKSLTVALDSFGNPQLFVIGLDDRVYTAKYNNTAGTFGAYALAVAGATTVKSVVVGHDATGNPQLFVIQTSDNQVYTSTYNATTGQFSAYTLAVAGQVKGLVVDSDVRGNPELFAVGLNDQIYSSRFNTNTNQFGPYVLTTAGTAKNPVVGRDLNGNRQLFVVRLSDNQVYVSTANPSTNVYSAYALAVAGAVNSFSLGQDILDNQALYAILPDNQAYVSAFNPATSQFSPYALAAPGQVKILVEADDPFFNPELFVTQTDDRVYTATMDLASGQFSSYALVASGTVKNPVATEDARGLEKVFAIRTSDNQVVVSTRDPSTGLYGAYTLAVAGAVKSLAVGHDAAGNPQLFVIGLNDLVYTSKYNPATGQFGPYALVTSGTVKDLVVGSDAAGNPQLFVIKSSDDQVYVSNLNPTTGLFSAYTLVAAGAVKDLVLTTDNAGNTEVFVIRSSDNQVYYSTFNTGTNQFNPYVLAATGAVKSLAVGTDLAGNPELFVIGLNDQVYSSKFNTGTNQFGPYVLTTSAAGGVTNLAVGRDVNGNRQFFVTRLSDNQVYSSTVNPATGVYSAYTLATAGAVSSFVLDSDPLGNSELFAIQLDNQLYRSVFNPATAKFGSYTLSTAGNRTVRTLIVSA